MPRKRPGRATWFKVHLYSRPVIDAVPNEAAGAALKAVMAYFADGTEPHLDPQAYAAFALLRASVDEANAGYAQAVANGRNGGRPPVTEGKGGLPRGREEDIRFSGVSSAPGFKAGEQYGIDPDYELFVQQEGNK